MNTRILVASDGHEEALGALRVARALARQRGRKVQVLGVVPPFALYGMGSEYTAPAVALEIERQQAAALRNALAAQLAEVGGEAEAWPIRIQAGQVASTIVRAAEDIGARLILLGIGRHRPVERWLGGETALSVIQLAQVPVFAIPPSARELPRSVLVAVDFSGFSLAAARSAIEVVDEAAAVHLVHVSWPTTPGTQLDSYDEWVKTYNAGARARLEELGRELAEGRNVEIHTHVVTGDASPTLLAVAEEAGAELIAAGSHGHGFFGRLILGSVSTRLIRRARCSVLVAPPHLLPAELERSGAPAAGSAHTAGSAETT